MYQQFFDPSKKGQPYNSEGEAIADIRAFVDLVINLVFAGKDPETERMDMRGVVITPQEFELALRDWTLKQRQPSGERMQKREAVREQITPAMEQIKSRILDSGQEGRVPKVHEIAGKLDLSEEERFCFWLALVLEYDRKYERLYGYLQDNVASRLPTVGLGLSLFGVIGEAAEPVIPEKGPLWTVLLKDLREDSGESRLSRPMCVRDEVLAFLRGEGSDEFVLNRESKPIPGAVKVRLVYGWEDLIAEEFQMQQLHQICDRIMYREKVMTEWGFGRKSPYGNGVSAIFYGSPGTGKTMAAQVIGKELGLEVFRIDLSQTVSKYIGETEKNMKNLFEAARERNLILFFDEADSLFAKRSEVSGSNDRYANMETGYLLQQFEQFEGIAILATNYIENLDDAFRRRIKFYVRFSFPDAAMRCRLWRSMLPEQAVLEEPVPFEKLAEKFELPGSDIKEIITNAAYLAAASDRGIRNEDIEMALKIHFLKMGKKIQDQELKIR